MGLSHSQPRAVATTLPDLTGKIVVITGCTSGTGLIVAKTSAQHGAKAVLMLNRPSERSTAAEQTVKGVAKEGTTVETIACDLQDFASVKEAAQTIRSKYEALDVLCNNAGVMALDDIATKELFPLLQRAKELRGEARIVHHSSLARNGEPLEAKYLEKNGGNLGGNENKFFFRGAKWDRYHQTKLANAVMTKALAKRLKDTGIKAAVAAPGVSATNLQVTTAKSGGMDGNMFIMYLAQSPEDGSMPILSACFDPSTENGDFWEPGKMGSMYGPPTKVQFDKNSMDEEQQKLLWEKSEEACGKFEI
jgi:NAD(P)-dependent dehydrogenase (short-subunit alcohol dehydrogenase family)